MCKRQMLSLFLFSVILALALAFSLFSSSPDSRHWWLLAFPPVLLAVAWLQNRAQRGKWAELTASMAEHFGARAPEPGKDETHGEPAAAFAIWEKARLRFQELRKQQEGERSTLSRNCNSVKGIYGNVNQSSVKVNSGIRDLAERIRATVRDGRKTVETTDELSFSLESIAAAIEEMTASISEVARNCQKELGVANEADQQASGARDIMENLGSSAQEITKIVEVIQSIASQTNLLALNATIEAASAGAAGKGFAVVANEVKELAKQTSSATEQIRMQVKAMQDSAAEAVKSMERIGGTISEVNQISSSIVSAVEEQSATCAEISRNVSHASDSAKHIHTGAEESKERLGALDESLEELSALAVGIGEELASIQKALSDITSLVTAEGSRTEAIA